MVRLGERQRPEQHRIDDREDCEVGAEADGQRGDCREREARSVSQPAKCVADVLPKPVDQAETARLPAIDRHVLDAAELAARAPRGLFRRHAASHEICGVCVHVETQLVGQVAFETAPADECRDE